MTRHIDLGVYPVVGEPGRYHVRSAGSRSTLYLVDLCELDSGWCGCPNFEFKASVQLPPFAECKHIRAARAYQRLQQRLTLMRGKQQ